MKKIILFIILILILLILAPNKMTPVTKLQPDTPKQCRVMAPLGGCINSCLGLKTENREESNECYSWYNQTCYGLIIGTCTENIINSKINYWK